MPGLTLCFFYSVLTMQQVQECLCVNTVKRLTTCVASPWSHSPRRSCWTGQWWSWGPGWATRSLPGRIASPTTTSSGGTPRTCGTSKALCCFFCFFLHGELPQHVEERYRPRGTDHSAQQGPLLLGAELHDARRLELLPDPLALLHIVDEHELHANVLTVGGLKEKGKKRDNP